ncbi:MAG TPA: hypothetical protein VF823_13465 [Anaerolineales bacterium]
MESTSQAVHEIIAAGATRHPELAVTVKKIVEASDEDDETSET